MKKSLLPLLLICFLAACQNNQKPAVKTATPEKPAAAPAPKPVHPIAEQIALKNGFANWNKVTQLDFTFNVDRDGNQVASRAWSWRPKTQEVTMIAGADTYTYKRAAIDSAAQIIDPGFINDKFWLLAPFQLVWDEGTEITVHNEAIAPLSGDTVNKLTVVYGNEGGYTPGDAYDFYYDEDYMISEWVFRQGNAAKPSLVNTFSDYKEINGIKFATMHADKTGAFKLYFTDIKVQVEE